MWLVRHLRVSGEVSFFYGYMDRIYTLYIK